MVLKEGETTEEDLISHLAADHPKWSLPDAIEFVDEIPHTATGKALKMALRERCKDNTPRTALVEVVGAGFGRTGTLSLRTATRRARLRPLLPHGRGLRPSRARAALGGRVEG